MSEEALQLVKERREAKGKGERERCFQLNSEFQRKQGEIRRPFSMNNANKLRKTTEWGRLEIKKTGDTKGKFHSRMGTIKDINSKT